jgi:L-threonylcarbamoyladenylate synthase
VLQEVLPILRKGGIIVFPTETFYGLGGNALDTQALERIYLVKGRPANLPVLCLVDGTERVHDLVREVLPAPKALMEAFWPGPITLVLPARAHLPPALVGPTGGVGVRWSSHPLVRGLVALLDAPLVGTSANISGQAPPSRVREISLSVRRGVQVILDGGPTPGGAPSTVLDCTVRPPRIIREGAIPRETLEGFLAL